MKHHALIATILSASASFAATSVSRHGITWTFDKDRNVGQFVNGDWWVVGPVTVVSVSPAPGEGKTPGEEHKSIYGTAATRPDTAMRNGSMIAAGPGGSQGFDSRLRNYKAELSVAFPVSVAPGQTLISSVSHGDENSQSFAHAILWRGEKQGFFALKDAAVLTVLDKAPPAGAFRPAFVGKAGAQRRIFTRAQVDTSKLRSLAPAPGMPDWAQYERYFERPYVADIVESWLVQVMGPSENQPCYGREIARIGGIAGLMLNTDAPLARKEKLLVGLIQTGIDIHGLTSEGQRAYGGDGGHWSGRKWPVFFAGVMLGDKKMAGAGSSAIFAEDQQTHYGKGWAGQRALFQNVFHSIPALPYEHKMPETWTDKDAAETGSNDKKSEGYRATNIPAWPATALAVRLMGLVKEWNHDAWIDYCDRVMSADDPYAEARKASTLPAHQVRPTFEGKTFDPWVDAMWKAHRASAPAPRWAGNNRMWVWTDHRFPGKGEWRPNPKPAEPAEAYAAPRQGGESAPNLESTK
jgi:hypothetical protein